MAGLSVSLVMPREAISEQLWN